MSTCCLHLCYLSLTWSCLARFCNCRKAREDERRSSGRLIEMVACYGDVVPRREFIILEEQFKVYLFLLVYFLENRRVCVCASFCVVSMVLRCVRKSVSLLLNDADACMCRCLCYLIFIDVCVQVSVLCHWY